MRTNLPDADFILFFPDSRILAGNRKSKAGNHNSLMTCNRHRESFPTHNVCGAAADALW